MHKIKALLKPDADVSHGSRDLIFVSVFICILFFVYGGSAVAQW